MRKLLVVSLLLVVTACGRERPPEWGRITSALSRLYGLPSYDYTGHRYDPETVLKRGGNCWDKSVTLKALLAEDGIDVQIIVGTHDGRRHSWCRWRGYILDPQLSESPLRREDARLYDAGYVWPHETQRLTATERMAYAVS